MIEKVDIKKISRLKIYLAVASLVILLTVTILRQTISNVFTLINDKKTKEEQLAVISEKANWLQKIDKSQLEARTLSVERVFPSKKPAIEIIYTLKNTANQNQVEMGQIQFNPGIISQKSDTKSPISAKDTSLKNFNLTITVTGTIESIGKFLNDLEKTAPLVKIDKLSLRIQKSTTDTKKIQLNLDLSIYYQTLPTNLPAIADPVQKLLGDEEEAIKIVEQFRYYKLPDSVNLPTGRDDLFETTP